MAGTPRRSLLIARLRGDLGDEPPGSGQQVILDELRRVILDGDVPPGTAIPVDEVAELFGVSRIPVREVAEDADRRGPGRPPATFRVHRRAADAGRVARDLRAARCSRAGGGGIGGRCCEPPADDDRAVQKAYDDLWAWRRRAADHRGYHRESRRFHLALLAPARTQRLLRMLESAWNLTEPVSPDGADPGLRTGCPACRAPGHAGCLPRPGRRAAAAVSAEHHRHLEESIAALPPGSAVFAWSDPQPPVGPR